MLGSSDTRNEYNQEQILLNSVSSIGIPLSLETSTTSSTDPSNLLHPSTSLNNSNVNNELVANTNSLSSITPTSATTSNKNDNAKNKNEEKDIKKEDTQLISKSETEDFTFKFNDHNNAMDIETIIPPTTTTTSTTINNINPSKEEDKNKFENLQSSLFLSSSLPLNLEDTSDFLNMDIDLLNSSFASGLEELNNLTLNINPTTSVTSVDTSSTTTSTEVSNTNTSSKLISTTEKSTTEKDPSSLFSSVDSISTNVVTSSSSPSSLSPLSSSSSSPNNSTSGSTTLVSGMTIDEDMKDVKKEEIKKSDDHEIKSSQTTTTSTTTTANTTTASTTNSTSSTTTTSDVLSHSNNSLDPMITDTTEKKDLLEFFNTEDFENNLKLFPFSDPSLLLTQQKDLNGQVPILTDQSLTDPATLSLLSNPTIPTNPNTLTTTTSTTTSDSTTVTATTTTTAAVAAAAAVTTTTPSTTNTATAINSSTNLNTTMNATNDTKSTKVNTVAAPAMAQSIDQAMILNPSLGMNGGATVVTAEGNTHPYTHAHPHAHVHSHAHAHVHAKAIGGIPPPPHSTNNLLTAGAIPGHPNPNSIIGLPPMMGNAPFYNLNPNLGVPNGIPNGMPTGMSNAMPGAPPGPGPKMNYYPPPPNSMVKPPPPPPPRNEIIMKKVYNGMVKQEKMNEMQKNAQGRDVLKTQLSTGKINLKELNEANPNVKINMKSVKSGGTKGRRIQSRNASLRPTLSYVELITEAICDSEDGLLSLQEIYDAIKRKYVYFRTADPAWQNSIRHNLSVHQSFTKITRPPNRPGKGFLWTSSKIDYQNLSAESRKRRKREHDEKSQVMGQTPSNNNNNNNNNNNSSNNSNSKSNNNNNNKNQPYRGNYPATTNGPMASTNVPPQNIPNPMNDMNYLFNQQQQSQHPRYSQKVMKLLSDNSINTPSLKQLLFTGFKRRASEPFTGHNGLNFPMNTYDVYPGQPHTSSLYGGSQYLVNSSAYSAAQLANSSIPLSLNSLIMPIPNASSALPNSNPTAFTTKGSSSTATATATANANTNANANANTAVTTNSSSTSSSSSSSLAASTFPNSFRNTTSSLPLTNMDGLSHPKYGNSSGNGSGNGNSLYPSLLDPEYSYRFPSHSMFRSSYYYPNHAKGDVMMHNTTRRYSFDSAMTSSAAFAAAARNNAAHSANPTPPFFSLAKSQSAKNVVTGPNYIKKDREKKIMYEKMHLTSSDYTNLVNPSSVPVPVPVPVPSSATVPPYSGNPSNYMAAAAAASATATATVTATVSATGTPPSLNFTHKHLSGNFNSGNNNLSIPSSAFNTSSSISSTIPSTKPSTTPMLFDTKSEHSAIDRTALSSAPTAIENTSSVIVATKEQA